MMGWKQSNMKFQCWSVLINLKLKFHPLRNIKIKVHGWHFVNSILLYLYDRPNLGLMRRKINNITSLLLLLAFLSPSIIKLGHHHHHSLSKTINDRQSHFSLEKCPICNFEFSIFLSSIEKIDLQSENPTDSYCNKYDSRYILNFSEFSFLLRAPPIRQI